MIKKHFKKLAEELYSTKPAGAEHNRLSQWENDIYAVARFFKDENAAFNEDRFLTACGFNLEGN